MTEAAEAAEAAEAKELAEQIVAAAVEPPPPDPPAPAPPPRQPPPQPASNVGRGAALVTAGILLSRLVGLVRQRVLAHYFGTGAFADVLTAAFRLGNLTQNLLGEGTLSATFIPIYAKLRGEGKDAEARKFALACLGLMLVVVAVASGAGALLAPWLSYLIAAGFDDARREATVPLVRILFPMTGLLGLSAWALGVLNAHRRFFLPYAAPVLSSLAQIAGVVAFGSFLHASGTSLANVLAWSALLGAALQLAVLLPAARRLVGGLTPTLDTKNPDVREAARRLPGALLGRGILQISGLLDTLLVSFLAPGDTAVFGYAQTIYLLPMALLGTGEAAAALPELARDTAEQDVEKRHRAMADRLGQSLGRVTALSVPAGLALAVLGTELTAILVQTGKFDSASSARVGLLLTAYGCALLPNAAGRVLATTSYALGDTRTPVRYALYRVIVSTLVALALMKPLGVLGVVIGAVTAGWVEAIALALRIRKNIGSLGLHHVHLARAFAAGALAAAAAALVRWALPAPVQTFTLATLPLAPALVLATFGAVFLVAAPTLGVVNLRSLLRRR